MKLPAIISVLMIVLLLSSFKNEGIKYKRFVPLLQLEGTWRMQHDEYEMYEKWTKVNDSLLTAVSYRVDEKDTIREEEITLKFSNGKVTYSPRVFNQNNGEEIDFLLGNISGRSYCFLNPGHDFPQSICYNIVSDMNVEVIVSGEFRGANRNIRFSLQRV